MPEIIIGEDAQKYIKNISFDDDAYSHYLSVDRNIPDAEIEKISIIFTNEGISLLAIANSSPAFINDGRHTIRISPTRFPDDIKKQGRILRHETEHIIQGCGWKYKAWVLGQTSFIGVSAIGSSALFAQQVFESTETLPDPARVTLTSFAGMGGIAAGAMFGSRIGKSLSPLELGAAIAERKYAHQLPDGTLTINN